MNQKVNKVYIPLFANDTARYFILMGGRGAGRSTVASQYALAKLVDPGYFRAAIMRLVLGDIRNSIYQDIKDRVEENGIQDKVRITHDLVFQYGKNKINGIGFKKSSGDQKSKLKSLAGYNCIIIEESDEVSEEDFMQLDDSLRTTKSNIKVILLLNPPNKNHWIIKRFFNLVESEDQEGFYIPQLKESCKQDTVFIHTSYLDNIQNITESTRRNYENYRIQNPEHYYNMIRGLVSQGVRGRIFTTWKPISRQEYEALEFEEFHGLDFGFTNDPTALLGVKQHNDKVYLRGLLYERGLTNPMISQRLGELGISKEAFIYADSSEPKSIEEIGGDGWNIHPAIKGQGSVNAGLDMMKSKEVYYVDDDPNLTGEVENYKWALDRNKEPTNTPVDEFNHYMDSARYGIYTRSKQPFIGFV